MMKLQSEELESVATIMRSLWLKRNALVYKNQFEIPFMVIQAAREELNEFHQAQILHQEKHNRDHYWLGQKSEITIISVVGYYIPW